MSTDQPLTDTMPAELDDLDFDASCSCDGYCCPHGTATECGEPATLIVTLHFVNGCNKPQCDADGNTVGPMCRTCLERIAAEIRHQINQIPNGFISRCLTCGAPIADITDVIRELRPL